MKKLVALFFLSSSILLADVSAVHGMLVFGSGPVYFSHLPMFPSPHDYQAVFQVELDAAAFEQYLRYRGHGEGSEIFTFVPTPFVLPDMIESPIQMQGDLYYGHFERGGQAIARDILVKVSQVIYAQEMPSLYVPPNELLEYIAFGTTEEQFILHVVRSGAPNYDYIAQVEPRKVLSRLVQTVYPVFDRNPIIDRFVSDIPRLPKYII